MRSQEHTAPNALSHDRHESCAHSSCIRFIVNVRIRNWYPRQHARKGSSGCLRARFGVLQFVRRDVERFDRKLIPSRLDNGDHYGFLALLRRQHEGADQRHMCASSSRIGTRYRARPQPRNDRRFGPVGQTNFGVQMPDPFFSLFAHPSPVAAHIFNQTFRTLGCPVLHADQGRT